MKAVGAPLVSAFFAFSASAFSTGTASSGLPLSSSVSNSTVHNQFSDRGHKHLKELEEEIKHLKEQLASASQCGSFGPAPSTYGSASASSTSPAQSVLTSVSASSSGPPSYSTPQASTSQALTSPVSFPAPSSSCSESSSGASSPLPSSAAPTPTNFYIYNTPGTGSETSTCTVIVTPGQNASALTTSAPSGSASGGVGVVTVTETYIGHGPIPPPYTGAPGASASAPTHLPIIPSGPASYAGNGTGPKNTYPTASGSGRPGQYGVGPTGTGSGTPLSTSAAKNYGDCSAICSNLTTFNDWDVTVETCTQLTAGTVVQTAPGEAKVGCATDFTTPVDLCQVTLNVKTSGTAQTYMEVWLPNNNASSWNGRTMNTDNGGLNGCVHYVDMAYVSGMGFAAIGDNAGHNSSSFDGTWMLNNNEAIVDWSYRARHASVDVGKQVVNKFYKKTPAKSYYIGCSAGGAQGVQSAVKFPNDFDGIISGSAANDFNHLQDWNAKFLQITGTPGNDTFLSLANWTFVQSYIFEQCDAKLDGVNDGILEDPTICDFDVTAIPVCNGTDHSACLTATQIETVKDSFKPLYNGNNLIYPPLLYGSQVDAFRLGLLSGTVQSIARDFFRGGVYNDSSFDITKITPADYTKADQLDALHGDVSSFNADLSKFRDAGKKMMMYHGLADPMTSGYNSQRYYQKVAKTMGLSNAEIDPFYRFFRISGMAHCGVGGISGAGAWMFGQSGLAAPASNNIVKNLVDWVENGKAPDSLLGTKFWYDTPSLGIEFERRHCRYPYRTTYLGGDATKPDSWGCKFIDDWQNCEGFTCNTDGTFT